VVFFHGHPAAAITDKFHCCQFIFADMFLINTRGTAETALFFITAGIAQMSRLVCNCPAAFTRVGHNYTPLLQNKLTEGFDSN
jgi:hypothetical protein